MNCPKCKDDCVVTEVKAKRIQRGQAKPYTKVIKDTEEQHYHEPSFMVRNFECDCGHKWTVREPATCSCGWAYKMTKADNETKV